MAAGYTINPVLNGGMDPLMVAIDLVPVTPNDGTDLVQAARGLRIQGGGTIRVTTYTGQVRNTTVQSNSELRCYVTRVHATGTTATGIEAML